MKWSGVAPDQVPWSAVSVEPTSIVPKILGETVFLGGSPATGNENAEVAVPLPNAFVAVTTTCRRLPM